MGNVLTYIVTKVTVRPNSLPSLMIVKQLSQSETLKTKMFDFGTNRGLEIFQINYDVLES